MVFKTPHETFTYEAFHDTRLLRGGTEGELGSFEPIRDEGGSPNCITFSPKSLAHLQEFEEALGLSLVDIQKTVKEG